MEKRNQLQNEALDALRKELRLILNWGTGVGKSRVAIMAMKGILKNNPNARILLMVQETAHKKNWSDEIINALGHDDAEKIISSITVDCYASLYKHENTSWDLIVFDEGHHLRSSIRLDIIQTMNAHRVLILTATLNDKNDGENMIEVLTETFGTFAQLTFELQDAIDNNILGIPEIHVIPVVLDRDNREKYESMSDYIDTKSREYFELRKFFEMERDDPENEETLEAKAKWLNAGARRKRCLGHAKTKVAKIIINKELKNKRLICFCASVDQIKWLGGENHVSGKNTPKQNAVAIEDFNEKRKDKLFAMGMLQEGQNLKDIQAGLIVQLDGKARSFIQKFGRVMRSKRPVLYIIYAKDTHDEDYLDNALKGIDKSYIIKHDAINTDCSPAKVCTLNPDYRPPVKPEDASKCKWTVDQNGGRYINTEGEESTAIKGFLTSIDIINVPFPMYVFNFQDEFNGTINAIHVNKKLSISIIASISSLSSPGSKPLMLKIYKNGAWAQYDLFCGRTKTKWNKEIIDNYPKNNEDKIPYLDKIVLKINNNIKIA